VKFQSLAFCIGYFYCLSNYLKCVFIIIIIIIYCPFLPCLQGSDVLREISFLHFSLSLISSTFKPKSFICPLAHSSHISTPTSTSVTINCDNSLPTHHHSLLGQSTCLSHLVTDHIIYLFVFFKWKDFYEKAENEWTTIKE